ncbi:hypothetical protein BT69DRAFT_1291296 [Atractiella rhizophila]|nr:hypothetical protein BT69DRAFT_1291296 [Atractiella rhizophila]
MGLLKCLPLTSHPEVTTPPASNSANPSLIRRTPKLLASSSNHDSQIIPATENEDAHEFVCGDMMGKYATLSVDKFLQMLPSCGDLPDCSHPAPDVSGVELTHYDAFITYMRPFVNETWELVNTSGKTDRDFLQVHGVGIKPDIVLYCYLGETNTVMKRAESFGEFKRVRKDEPFRDGKDGKVSEGNSQAAKLARGQITIYSSVLSSQQRTRRLVFSFCVREHSAHLLCHSRAGFLVTPRSTTLRPPTSANFFGAIRTRTMPKGDMIRQCRAFPKMMTMPKRLRRSSMLQLVT